MCTSFTSCPEAFHDGEEILQGAGLLHMKYEYLAMLLQKQYVIASDAIDGRQRGEMLIPWQAKCKKRTATLNDISVLVFVWFSVVCCFCVF